MIKYQPIGYRVLIKPDKVEEAFYDLGNGKKLLMAAAEQKQEQQAQVLGTVLEVGGDAFSDSADKVQVGDRVLYQRYSGMRIPKTDGTFEPELLVLNDRDITARIKEIPDEEIK